VTSTILIVLRRLPVALSVASLVLSVALLAMWVRSYWVGDTWLWQRVTRDERIIYSWYMELTSGAGGIGLSRDTEDYDARYATVHDIGADWSFARREARRPAYPQPAFFVGPNQPATAFAFRWNGNRAGTRRELILPYWILVLLFAIAPALSARRVWLHRRARRRRRANACPACGYDLRASPERCPECGAMPARGAGATAGVFLPRSGSGL
jgi:hypothetical protein